MSESDRKDAEAYAAVLEANVKDCRVRMLHALATNQRAVTCRVPLGLRYLRELAASGHRVRLHPSPLFGGAGASFAWEAERYVISQMTFGDWVVRGTHWLFRDRSADE